MATLSPSPHPIPSHKQQHLAVSLPVTPQHKSSSSLSLSAVSPAAVAASAALMHCNDLTSPQIEMSIEQRKRRSSMALPTDKEEVSEGEEDIKIDVQNPKDPYSINSPFVIYSSHFAHHVPLLSSRGEYFPLDTLDRSSFSGCMSVLVCVFNEAANELQATLNDLYAQHKKMYQEGFRLDMNVCVVLDGWGKASNSMKRYIKQCFPVSNTASSLSSTLTSPIFDSMENRVNNWLDYVNEWEFDGGADNVDTLILQRRGVEFDSNYDNLMMGGIAHVPINPSHSIPSFKQGSPFPNVPALKTTIIIKRDNRRKHNTHEWFLCGYAPAYSLPYEDNPFATSNSFNAKQMQFIFLTDCGTRFHHNCLLELTEYCALNADVVGASGRNRIMSFEQQSAGENEYEQEQGLQQKTEGLFEWMYRAAQGYDYEASVVSLTPAFSSLANMLPVIPGPAGIFRLDLLADQSAAAHQRKLNEEIIKLTVVSLKDQLQKEGDALKEQHGKANAFVHQRIKELKQLEDWQNSIRISNNNAPTTIPCSPNSISKSSPSLQSDNSMNSMLSEPISPHTPLSPKMKQLISDCVTNSPVFPSKGNISPSLNLGDTESAIVALLTMIITTHLHYENECKLVCTYLRFLLERCSTDESLIDDHFYESLTDNILDLTRIFNLIRESLRQFSIVTAQITTINASPTLIVSQLLLRSLDMIPLQQEQLASLYVFKSILVNLLCSSSRSKAKDKEALEVQMLNRLNAPHSVTLALENYTLDQELIHSSDAIDFYFRCVNRNPNEVGLLLGSLLLAEDRILSYAAVLKSKLNVRTAFVRDAVFFCQAETKAMGLFAQRRRWINGTVAGYIWLFVLQYNKVFGTYLKSWSWIFIYLLFAFQILQYVVTSLTPVMYSLCLQFSIKLLVNSANATWLMWAHFLFYSAFVLLHARPEAKIKFHPWLYQILAGINSVILILGINALIDTKSLPDIGRCIDNPNGWFGVASCFSLATLVVAVLAIPYVLAIVVDIMFFLPSFYCLRSRPSGSLARGRVVAHVTPRNIWELSAFVRLCRFTLGYYLLLPTLTMLLPVYSLARTFDRSWGNRPSITLAISSRNKEDMEQMKQDVINTSHTITGLIWGVNFLLFLLILEVSPDEQAVAIIAAVALGFPIVQMVFSLLVIVVSILIAPFNLIYVSFRSFLCFSSSHASPSHAEIPYSHPPIQNNEINNNHNGLMENGEPIPPPPPTSPLASHSLDIPHPLPTLYFNNHSNPSNTDIVQNNDHSSPTSQVLGDMPHPPSSYLYPTPSLSSPIAIGTIQQKTPGKGMGLFPFTKKKFKFSYNDQSFHAPLSAPKKEDIYNNLVSPTARMQQFMQKYNYESPRVTQQKKTT